ncbi:MAG: GH77, partial [uncultured Gemmatimonadaceae bacterium]
VARVPLPADLPLGRHRVRVALGAGGGARTAEQTLIVAPDRCPDPAAVLQGQRAFGLTANLYAVRSGRNWGAGDATDLRELVRFAAGAGAAFVGVNPLHALRNAGDEISPYSPVSRLFRNVLYLDVDALPELADAPEARRMLAAPAFRRALARLRAATHVDYAAVMRLKLPALELLHAAFRRRTRGPRRRAYGRYVAAQGEALARFATFLAIEETAGSAGGWRAWPEPLQSPESPAVAAHARAHADRVDFHRWLQFALDEQLAAAAAEARARGLPVGLYQDLAIGTSPSSSDAWSFPGLFVEGASIGAPPDPLAPQGQNWGLPPLHPHRLAEQGYGYWGALVRGALRHAGALRIDHVIGLFRQFWIPAGMSGAAGAYVRVPTRDLLAVLALESTRAGALVVGEDLGTVPPEVPAVLERWGILSSRVLYFEREGAGDFKPARAYPRLALATANTHDLPTLAGFRAATDVTIRRRLGLVDGAPAERAARRARADEVAALVRRLADEGIVDATGEPDDLALRAAVHTFLRRTPAWLVGLSLDDLVGEAEPVNVPGVPPADFPSWTRRLTTPLEALAADPAVRRALGAEREWAAGVLIR